MGGTGKGRYNSSRIAQADNSNQKCPGLAPTVGVNASVGNVYRKKLGCCSKCVIVPTSFACGTSVGGIRKYRC